MKVLHVETGRNLFGGPLQVSYLLRGLHERGVRNVLVCTVGSAIGGVADEVVERLYEVSMSGDLDVGFVWRLRRILRRESPDLIHLHSRRGADLFGGVAGRMEGIPVILSRRVVNPEPRWWVALKYRLYDRVIAISRGIQECLLEEGVSREKVVCVPSAVDLEKYTPGCERTWFRGLFGIGNRPAIGVVAQLVPLKGHRYLLEAIPTVLQYFPEVQFLFFGKGALEGELHAEIVRRGLADNVRLAGFRDDLERVLPCLEMVVHPATMEGLGVSLLQAAACGVPIVASAVGGIPEIVRDGVNGCLVPPRDPRALAQAILSLLDAPPRAREMGMSGRMIVERDFCIPAMVEGNLKVYEAVTGG